MAEWLRRGLQILARRFDSGSGLHLPARQMRVSRGQDGLYRGCGGHADVARAAQAAAPDQPWLDPKLAPEARAQAALAAMTLDEKLRLIFGYSDQAMTELAKVPDDIVSPELKTYVVTHQVKGSAGFVPGVPRLGIPDQTQTDASIGVRNSFIPSTALPSSLATAASFDPEVVRARAAR